MNEYQDVIVSNPSIVAYIPSIISAIGVIVAAFLSYNQYTKNKKTDIKIEQWKKSEDAKNERKSENISKIYGEMWQLLHDIVADRVYIIQPHPLTNAMFISASLEVKRNGVSSIKPYIQKLPMEDVASFSAELSARDFLLYRDVDNDVKDKRARALLSTNGCHSTCIKRLVDDEHGWVGSIVCGFTHDVDLNTTNMKLRMTEAANNIQYILPEYK